MGNLNEKRYVPVGAIDSFDDPRIRVNRANQRATSRSYTVPVTPTPGSTTSQQTITGTSRIQAITLRTLTGLARIGRTVLETITGQARLQKTVDETVTGVSRIQRTVGETLDGTSRVQKTIDETITGVAAIDSGVVDCATCNTVDEDLTSVHYYGNLPSCGCASGSCNQRTVCTTILAATVLDEWCIVTDTVVEQECTGVSAYNLCWWPVINYLQTYCGYTFTIEASSDCGAFDCVVYTKVILTGTPP